MFGLFAYDGGRALRLVGLVMWVNLWLCVWCVRVRLSVVSVGLLMSFFVLGVFVVSGGHAVVAWDSI